MSPLEPVTATSIARRPVRGSRARPTIVETANNASCPRIPDVDLRRRFFRSTIEAIVSDTKRGSGDPDEGRTGSGFQPLRSQRRIDFGVLGAIVAAVALLIFILQNTERKKSPGCSSMPLRRFGSSSS